MTGIFLWEYPPRNDRQGGSAGPTEEKNTHSHNGVRAAAWRVQGPVPVRAWRRLAAALMSGSVTYRAGWIEASQSNSFHTYLMLVTVAETLHRVIELMRYLRKCIFFLYKKISHGREGEPLMGSFHTGKLSFFLYCGFLFFFLSETGDRKLPAGRSLQLSPQKGRAALVAPPELYPGLRAPGHQARPPPPQRKQEKGRAGRTQPTRDDWNGTSTSLCLPRVETPKACPWGWRRGRQRRTQAPGCPPEVGAGFSAARGQAAFLLKRSGAAWSPVLLAENLRLLRG